MGWSVKDKVEVFSQSKDAWCLGYIKRVDRHVVCVSYSVGEQVSDQLTKEVRVFDAAIRKPSPEALRKDEEKKKKIAAAKQAKIEEEQRKVKEEEDLKKREAEEKRRAKVQEEQAKQRAKEEEQQKFKEQQDLKKAEEEKRKANGDCPAYEGMKITAFWRDTKNEAHNGWYGAIVETVNPDDTFNILFNDGHRRANVKPDDIEELKEWAAKKKAEAGEPAETEATTTEDAVKEETVEDTPAPQLDISFVRVKGFSGSTWAWKKPDGTQVAATTAIEVTVNTKITLKWEGDGVDEFYLRDMSTEDGATISDGKGTELPAWAPKEEGTVTLEVWKSSAGKQDRKKEGFSLNVVAA